MNNHSLSLRFESWKYYIVAVLGMGNARNSEAEKVRYVYAPADGHASHEKFSPTVVGFSSYLYLACVFLESSPFYFT